MRNVANLANDYQAGVEPQAHLQARPRCACNSSP
jgi:hypothetical protein